MHSEISLDLSPSLPEELMSMGYRFKTDMYVVFVYLHLQGWLCPPSLSLPPRKKNSPAL
jgi:hypothetical protein